MTKSFPLLLSAALLLTACGKAPATAPAAQLLTARAAAAQAATPSFGAHLVVKQATADVQGNDEGARRQEVFTVAGTVDGKPFSFSTSTFFPYYVPMFGTATINGKDQKLTPALARALQKLFKAADASAKQKEAMNNLLYGLDFLARREGEQPAN